MGGKSIGADRLLLVAVVLIAILFLLISPVGFTGGGNDDQHYLAAARCWVEAGGCCLPTNHWQARWPTVAPIAALFSLFGDSRTVLGIAPLISWISALVMIGWLGRLWFDRTTGLLAAVLFAAVPALTLTAFQPNIDNVELTFQLGALCLATIAYRRQCLWIAIAAGVAASIAIQARETSLIFCLVSALAWLTLAADRRQILLYALVGLCIGIGTEMLVYAVASGDALFRYRLALGHGSVASAELAPSVDSSRSAIMNPEFIAGWRREMGIRLWWPIDPWLNLIATPRLGATLALAAFGLRLTWSDLSTEWKARLKPVVALSILFAILLIYGFAIDPKSRMFLLPAAAATLGLAASLVTAWRHGRRTLVVVVAALLALVGGLALHQKTDPRPFERAAQQWIAKHPGMIEIDEPTQSVLALVPDARRLPIKGSGKPLRLTIALQGCRHLVQPTSASAPLGRILGAVGDGAHEQLCLLAYTMEGQAKVTRQRQATSSVR